ncbi:hypothetical protein [Nocardia sp. NPDC005998]|uniref:hypothetical protein n=1 Tax=Nocardia sp. NPDC005998 TaxID=3156894 RepID=UPI0033BA2005
MRDRSTEVDPTEIPASCRSSDAGNYAVTQVLTDAGERANAVNFANTFEYTLWYGVGLLAVMCLGFLVLPRDARPEHLEIDDPLELVPTGV